VVGPNGCGKSNVIDAVRWVMGEGSARLLRGESMADVIFNGTVNRKSVKQASVELVFDNSNTNLSGQYANCTEISIQRTVSRDATSNYYLNNARCRRRDITELFMGTGLGARSYSIIEQGMISRFIEAHPDDLRAFVEEAAGIAKYKERRKEAEVHIANTKENLSRLSDLREEVTKNLHHLQQQAAAAEQYQALQANKQRLESELLALRWRTLEQKRLEQTEVIYTVEAASAVIQTEQTNLDISLEQQRNQHEMINDQLGQLRSNYYTIGTDIARIEQTIKLQNETVIKLQMELNELIIEQTNLQSQLHINAEQCTITQNTLFTQQNELTQLNIQQESYNVILEQIETTIHLLQIQWEEFQLTANEPAQLAQLARLKLNHLEQQLQELEQRYIKLSQDVTYINLEELNTQVAILETGLHDCELLAISSNSLEQLEKFKFLLACMQMIKQHIVVINSALKQNEYQVEKMEVERNTAQIKLAIETIREQLYAHLKTAETMAQQRDTMTLQRNQLNAELDQAKVNVKTITEKIRVLTSELEAIKIKYVSLINSDDNLRTQLMQFNKRENKIKELLLQTETPLEDLTLKLDTLSEQRLHVETELNNVKTQLDMITSALRVSEQARQHLEKKAKIHRESLEQARLIANESIVQTRILEEQLTQGGYHLPEILITLPTAANTVEWERELEHCNTQLQHIGLVNLAAIDELKQITERKTHLDNQYEDVNQALLQLDAAIEKIDQETKIRFQETFDNINAGLNNLFPRLFGGGQAYLELTKNDILNAGVTIMARPPGKRNSNIHLLSGGEKALTAVALVFAIFQLNPAPFCMLDEVDAPLDDANVKRFCDLVHSMSNQVQFIFITHNKVTMELANQLIGVTMNEPGVSRLVTVDINEAVKLSIQN
jgi:chromosome segregation protein